jgi:hypothetical protein
MNWGQKLLVGFHPPFTVREADESLQDARGEVLTGDEARTLAALCTETSLGDWRGENIREVAAALTREREGLERGGQG